MKAQTTLCTYSANLKAIIALIFFCFLFFHQGKKMKSGCGGEAPAKAPTNLLRLPYAPYEGRNNPLHLFGQLEGDHRLDLLLLPFLPSREEKEVGARGRSPRESPNEPPTPTKRTHEGPNNSPRPFGQLDGNHRMNPLVIHLHSSIRETKCGAHSRTIRLRFSKLLSPIQRTK